MPGSPLGRSQGGRRSAASCAGLAALINLDFAPMLLGQDPRDISRLWDVHVQPPREASCRRAQGMACRSTRPARPYRQRHRRLDIALWDILGKSLRPGVAAAGRAARGAHAGLCVGRLGGRRQYRQAAVGLRRKGGFRAVKMRVGVMDGTPARSAARVKRGARGPGPG